jgi:hypothetical protein
MRPEIHVTARVQPGGRVEVVAPELREGEEVEITIAPVQRPAAGDPGLLEFLKSLPPSRRTLAEWDEFDREFRKERDAWER